jgi:hypothetical protein
MVVLVWYCLRVHTLFNALKGGGMNPSHTINIKHIETVLTFEFPPKFGIPVYQCFSIDTDALSYDYRKI